MRVVVDASVALKWLFADPEREQHTELATQLMSAVVRRGVEVLQPMHWLVEVAAVLARETPARAGRDVVLLYELDLPVLDGPEVLARACRLSSDHSEHLFDTLYHAVALESDATLITADERYLSRTARAGHIQGLADWRPPG